MSNTKDNGLFYVECVGDRWGQNPIEYKSLAQAEVGFSLMRDSKSRTAREIRLYDCTNSPVGTLLAKG